MAYECPVCDSEEADGEHLANHLAFVALTRGGDHEAWLDDHVPDWEQRDPGGLADEVTPYATETETETASEPHDEEMPARGAGGGGDLSGEAAEILEEAQEMTREMVGGSESVGDSDGDEEAAGDSESE